MTFSDDAIHRRIKELINMNDKLPTNLNLAALVLREINAPLSAQVCVDAADRILDLEKAQKWTRKEMAGMDGNSKQTGER